MIDPKFIKDRIQQCSLVPNGQTINEILTILAWLNDSIAELSREQLKDANEFRRALGRGNLLP